MSKIDFTAQTSQPKSGIIQVIKSGNMSSTIYQKPFKVGDISEKEVQYDPSTGEVFTLSSMFMNGTSRNVIKKIGKGFGFPDAQNALKNDN